jgi:hypothetical protein
VKNKEFADLRKFLSPPKNGVLKSQKILGQQIANPQIAALAEGPQI